MDSGVSGIGGRLEPALGALPDTIGWDELQRAKPVPEDVLVDDRCPAAEPSAPNREWPDNRARPAVPGATAQATAAPGTTAPGTTAHSMSTQSQTPATDVPPVPAGLPGPRGGTGRTPAPSRPAGRPSPAAQPRPASEHPTGARSRSNPPATPGAPPAPPFAAPSAPTAPPGTGLTRRLLSMLPWPTGGDPVGELVRQHRSVHPGGDPNLLRRAYAIAEEMHRGQTRKSGDPYITHPLAVAEILAELGMDTTTLVAALLHDTVEDTSYTLQALEGDFGAEVALLVDGVTKFDKVFYGDAAEAETIRKMIIAAGRDVRVLVIKLADRLHNMRTLDARSPASRARIARATRDVLVPLCDRLGIQALKRDLEDCVLKALSPSGYALVADYVAHRRGRGRYLDRVIAEVRTELNRAKVDAKVSSRPRHLYSIWKDTVAGNYTEPHDLPRVVIVVNGPDTDCYAALGAMHGRWRPVPGRFKDFIASPKNNLYRSLHTTVLGPDEELLEVLIRTEPMHRDAEYGIVANFRYPLLARASSEREQLAWLRRVLDWESSATDPAQFLASLRCDLAESQIIVFTSTGRPVLLPAEATPVDLAYTLGQHIGDRCIGARLNGRLVALSSGLDDGDVVEIITRQGQRDEFDFDDKAPAPGPSREWLQFVKTPQARLHISDWFTEKDAPAVTIADKVRLGRLAIGLALRQRGRGLGSDLPLVRLAVKVGYPDLETLLVAVAEHKLAAPEVVDQLIASVDHTPH
ncbi:RelA/SpoT family protein [Planosporangium sp. 12N6]|uniref:RelA/SpoT family protein n=1 Tax=Planosporangium spinosum TaxID=3402278 RepID=UPI003CF3889E